MMRSRNSPDEEAVMTVAARQRLAAEELRMLAWITKPSSRPHEVMRQIVGVSLASRHFVSFTHKASL